MMTELYDIRKETEAARMLLDIYADILSDDDEKADAIEGETNLNEAIVSGLERIAALNALIEGGREVMNRIKSRVDRLESQAEGIKTAIGIALEATDTKKIETPLATVSLSKTPATAIITDESSVPARFWKPQDPKLDKRAVLAALKEGDVPGAELSNGGVSVRITSR